MALSRRLDSNLRPGIKLLVPVVCVATALLVGPAGPASSQSATTSTNPATSTLVPAPLDAPELLVEGPDSSGGNPYAATPVTVNGPAIAIPTEQPTAATFAASAGETVAIRSNRPWSLQDPTGRFLGSNRVGSVLLPRTGRYVIVLEAGLQPPAQVSVRTVDSNALVTPMTLGAPITFQPTELRSQIGRVAVKGGQRYRIVMQPNQAGGEVCVTEQERTVNAVLVGCAQGIGSPNGSEPRAEVPFALDHDAVVSMFPVGYPTDAAGTYPVIAAIEEAPNDIIADVSTNPIIEAAPGWNQNIVVPFWGNPAQRAVISSPNESAVLPGAIHGSTRRDQRRCRRCRSSTGHRSRRL